LNPHQEETEVEKHRKGTIRTNRGSTRRLRIHGKEGFRKAKLRNAPGKRGKSKIK